MPRLPLLAGTGLPLTTPTPGPLRFHSAFSTVKHGLEMKTNFPMEEVSRRPYLKSAVTIVLFLPLGVEYLGELQDTMWCDSESQIILLPSADDTSSRPHREKAMFQEKKSKASFPRCYLSERWFISRSRNSCKNGTERLAIPLISYYCDARKTL